MSMFIPTLAVWYINLMIFAFVVICVLLMLVILIQRPRGGGLSGAFGGAGGSAQTAFGAKTGDVLTGVTVGFFVLFILLAMGLTWSIDPSAQTEPTVQPAEDLTDADFEDAPLATPPVDTTVEGNPRPAAREIVEELRRPDPVEVVEDQPAPAPRAAPESEPEPTTPAPADDAATAPAPEAAPQPDREAAPGAVEPTEPEQP